MATRVGRRIVNWIYQHETLVAGFGATTMVIANESYGRKNIKDELKEDMNKLETKIDAGFDELKEDMNKLETKMDAGFKATQTVIVEGAECTMKALKGNQKPMEGFLQKAEKYWDCMKSPEDCVNGVGSEEKDEN